MNGINKLVENESADKDKIKNFELLAGLKNQSYFLGLLTYDKINKCFLI